MQRFILLDPSLKTVGGHHFDYDLHVLRAAAEAGCETVLLGHARFGGDPGLPANCRVLPFGFNPSKKHSIFAHGPGGRFRVPPPATRSDAQPVGTRIGQLLRSAGRRLMDARQRRQGERLIADFERCCHRAFATLGLQAGDVVFLPNVSGLDLEGLVRFLRSDHRSREVDWHVQFHLNILDGREPDYACQGERLALARSFFAEVLAQAGDRRLHFYNTSDILARQYNRMGVATFRELPYPINPAFARRLSLASDLSAPLRITCAGGIRAEKGQGGLGDLVRELWAGCLDSGRAQLVLQSKRSRLTRGPRHPIALPDRSAAPRRTVLPGENCRDPVVYVRYPLDLGGYEQLVLRADIGLFLYDSLSYYSRRAGVLGEMLAAGVPVIVPAGCWLSEQIAQPNYLHAAQVAASLPRRGGWTASAVDWQRDHEQAMRTGSDGVLSIPRRTALRCVRPVPANSMLLAVAFDWLRIDDHGTYLRLELEQLDAAGSRLDRAVSVLGPLDSGPAQATLFRLSPGAHSVCLSLRNAYGDEGLSLGALQACFLGSAATHESTVPLGVVGLVAADPGQVSRLLREMIQHYTHYRASARDFSAQWFGRHDPSLTVQTLLDASRQCPADRPLA